MKNLEIAQIFERMSKLLEIQGEIVFKIRAYERAAENIANLTEDIAKLREEKRLSEVGGLGTALQEKIGEYLDTGKIHAYEELIQKIPESLLDVMNVPSVGPKKAKLFFDELKIKDIEGLRKSADQGKLLELPGIQAKTVENILKGIKVLQAGQERMNLGVAVDLSDQIIAQLKKLKSVKKISVAGSLRRMKETIRDIDILVVSLDPQKVMDAFVSLPQVKSVNVHGETKSSILTNENIQVDLRVIDEKIFGAALLYFTGSKNFNVKLRQIAIKEHKKVSEYGIFSVKGDSEKTLASKTEEDCFQALGFPYIPPELREDIGEKELFGDEGFAKIKKVPSLLELEDIKGEWHVHSTYSDGHDTICAMAESARQRGYQYLAISDHSPRLRVAGGVSVEDLKKKKKEIDELNGGYKDFRILFGTEVEIDSDGNLDYNDKILSEFDIVIAAIHSGFEQSRDKLTRRLVKACSHKSVNAIAHPTGVHLGKRDPYDIDFKEVCKAAVDHNTYLEINAFPHRLDLNSAHVYFARSQGVRFVINTDAHRAEHMGLMKFGVAVARRGWLTKKDVVNTLSLSEMLKQIKK
ncbi:MAG: DNA polymerase/3'-5' exonuclease PolX [Candidatus Omnitrophica bacterium]|nr:DNA polymerase/3'-5' exonuclease PolX [Candidatus Omnitrophota bacterium]